MTAARSFRKWGRSVVSHLSRRANRSCGQDAVREFSQEYRKRRRIKVRSSRYLNNLIEQDHRAIKSRIGPMLGFKDFAAATITLAGVEMLHRIRQGQFAINRLDIAGKSALEIWSAVLAA
jgi:transposase-like protein